MSSVSGFGALLQIPVRLPDLVSPEKRKQGLARRLRHKFPLKKGGQGGRKLSWQTDDLLKKSP
jgi:hypothetical protein